VPILAVNIGEFGFITEVSKNEWRTAFEGYISGRLGVSERLMLEVVIRRKGEVVGTYCALNDALICAHNVSKVVRLDVSISNTELVATGPTEFSWPLRPAPPPIRWRRGANSHPGDERHGAGPG